MVGWVETAKSYVEKVVPDLPHGGRKATAAQREARLNFLLDDVKRLRMEKDIEDKEKEEKKLTELKKLVLPEFRKVDREQQQQEEEEEEEEQEQEDNEHDHDNENENENENEHEAASRKRKRELEKHKKEHADPLVTFLQQYEV